MAEAHSAVAFSFTVTPDGVNVNLNHEAIKAVWDSGLLSWKKRIGRMKNNFRNGVYPASPVSLIFTITLILALVLGGFDPSYGSISFIEAHIPLLGVASPSICFYLSCVLFSTVLWLVVILVIQYTLRLLLTYHNWIYEVRGPISLKTKIWMGLVRVFGGRKPLLNSYQGSLPKLFVPPLDGTVSRYLKSVIPLLDEEKYARMERLAKEFQSGIGNKLQRYLILKSWWGANYVSDWWENYVYLRGRSPIMINSNFYGIDAVLEKPHCRQLSRAANIIYAILQYRRDVDRQELKPILLNKSIPLCSAQYERQFNTTRIPGIETDTLVHHKDSNHIAVFHRGRYFKVYIRHKGRLLKPKQIEVMLQRIVDDKSEPAYGEKHLAALTAGERVPWAKARLEYFSKGKNKASLHAIEKAAFCVTLDKEPHGYDPADPRKLDRFGMAMLHGKGYDRWFDKSFTLVVCSNGHIGFNAEHSWADAPIMAHMWEYSISQEVQFAGADAPIMGQLWEVGLAEDRILGYTEEGHCMGEADASTPNPIRLEWDISEQANAVIESSLQVARQLISDVDLHILMYKDYGKGFIKKCKVSPDAFIQMGLQLTYYRSASKFCLTYESSMTRLFREGRTETVRSCTEDSCAFVKAMEDKNKTNEDRIKLLRKAADTHQHAYRESMTGLGIDRHLFCLYVVSKYLGVDSPFLAEVLSEPWRLSTSQTPHQQTDMLDLKKFPDRICGGGGFGPVADDGYGVSYIVAGEDTIFFHISSKKSCPSTNSDTFGRLLRRSLLDMQNLFTSQN